MKITITAWVYELHGSLRDRKLIDKDLVTFIMADSKIYGIVVIGLGIAGKVRLRDLSEITSHGDINWSLKGFLSRRTLEIDGVKQLSEEEVFSRSDVDAIIICTENALHEQYVRKGLENGKHVLCEYPAALTSTVAKEFFQLANQKALILHEENIGLLNDYKEKLMAADRWTKGEISLSGRYNGWVEDYDKSGPPFVSNVSLIQTVYHLCGNVTATGGHYDKTESGHVAEAKLKTEDDREITVTLKRSKDNEQRVKTVVFDLEGGTQLDLVPKVRGPPKKPGLFMQDFIKFMEKVKNKENNDTDVQRTLRCLEIAEDVHQIIMPKL